jgi:glycosyltransferase involved in cell wall biosynthesis
MTLKKQKTGLFWVSYLITDVSLYKSTQFEILKNLSKLEYNVKLIATYSRKNEHTSNNNINVSLFPLRYFPVVAPIFYTVLTLIFLPFLLIKEKPKYVIVEPGLSILVFMWKPLLACMNSRLILDIRTTPVEIVNFRRYLSSIWFNISVLIGKKFFDGMTILTTRMRKDVCDRFRIDPNHVGVWTSGVSTETFNASKYNSKQLRMNLDWTDKFVMIYHGTLDFHRGLIEAIRAVKIAEQKCPKLRFCILGSGPATQSLKNLVNDVEVNNRVIFLPPVSYEQVPSYIASSDFGIVPLPDIKMWQNQSPLKLMEYLAMGKVVIATDIPMMREVIGTSKCGVFIPRVTPDEIAKAIIYIYNNREKLEEYGLSGPKIIEDRYTWAKISKNLDSYLKTKK